MKITNENNENFGLYCGLKTGHTVLVTGEYVVMTFHSDYLNERSGFLLFFSSLPHGKDRFRGGEAQRITVPLSSQNDLKERY